MIGCRHYKIVEGWHILFIVNMESAGVQFDIYESIFERCRNHAFCRVSDLVNFRVWGDCFSGRSTILVGVSEPLIALLPREPKNSRGRGHTRERVRERERERERECLNRTPMVFARTMQLPELTL
ncbi:hypothetical protein LguiB_018891 [Lonicera macranthoides]